MFVLVTKYRRSDLKTSRLIYEIAAEKSALIGNDTLWCKCLLNSAVLCNELGDFSTAGNYLRKADQLAENSGHTELQIKVLGETGRLYVFNDQPDEALNYYKRVVEKCKEPKFNNIRSVVLGNIGGIYYEKSKTETDRKIWIHQGLPYTKESFQLANKMNNLQLTINQGNNLALMYADLEIADSSLYYLNIINPLIRNDNLKSLSTYYSNLGKVRMLSGNHDEALEAYKQSLSLTMQTKAAYDEFNIYKSLSTLYEGIGQMTEALKYERKAVFLHDSLINAENFSKLAELQSLYEKEKSEGQILKLRSEQNMKDLEISRQRALARSLEFESDLQKKVSELLFQKNQMQEMEILAQSDRLEKNKLQAKADSQAIKLTLQDNAIKSDLISRQRRIGTGMLILTFILGAFAFVLHRLNQSRKRAYEQLAKTNEAIKAQSEILQHQSKTIAGFKAQMNPHFVFNALHKVQGSILSGQTEEAALQLRQMAGLMRITFDNAQRDEITLDEELTFLRNYVAFEQKNRILPFNFTTEISGDTDGLLLPPMMIQPLIENSLKHGISEMQKDAFVKLQIDARPDGKVLICVEDNGKGMSAEHHKIRNKLHALSVLQNRVELAMGNLVVENGINFKITSPVSDHHGTKTEFYLPSKYAY